MSVLLRMLDLFITLDSLGKSRQVVWHFHHLSPGFVINMMYVHAQQLHSPTELEGEGKTLHDAITPSVICTIMVS